MFINRYLVTIYMDTSFHFVQLDDSDDEIVWSLSDDDDDYILLERRPTTYRAAADYMTRYCIRSSTPLSTAHNPQKYRFLSNPHPNDPLTLLQSLIIQLGISAPLPKTITAARALFKSSVFLNIRDYLATRNSGQAALQKVMHPSRRALIRDVRRKGHTASLSWVKAHGLQVLLVTCHH
jgi:hypothetical protein